LLPNLARSAAAKDLKLLVGVGNPRVGNHGPQREGPQVVSRRGIETAVLVPIEEWRRVQARSRPSLKALLLTAEPRIEALAPERSRARRRAVVELGGKGVSA